MRVTFKRPIVLAIVFCGAVYAGPGSWIARGQEGTQQHEAARTGDAVGKQKVDHATAPSQGAVPSGEVPRGETGAAGKAGEAKPGARTNDAPIYYARDKEGRLVPLLGFSYEELLKVVEQQRQGAAASAPPQPYNLQQLTITGECKADHAELEAVYKLQLESAEWVEVPLVSDGAVLRELEKYQGPGEHSLFFDAATGSYKVRLHGEKRSEHQITLKIEAPVKTIGGLHRLEMTLPVAAASRLVLRVPEANLAVTNHAGAATSDVKSAAGGTEISLLGLGGPFSLAWKDTGAAAVTSPSVLESTGDVLARIDSRSVQFEATLTVRSLGAEFDHFHIKLPPNAQWVRGEPGSTAYTMAASGDAAEQLVEVQLAQKTTGPVEVRLRAERAYDVTKPDETLELAGFEVVEAVPHRQWGHLGVAVVGDWQLTWGRRDRMQQIDELPEALKRKDVVAGFEYFGQPASLAVHITPRKTRISVEPEYVYFIEPQQVRLEARLKYAIRGAKAFALDIGLAGWQVDEIGPASAVDADAALASTGPIVKVPLIQATSGDMELTVKAHRSISADATRLELTLPTLFADVQGPALVAIVPADNVGLHPIDAELRGLRREASIASMKLPTRQQPALFYRGEQALAKFAGEIERLPQEVSAAVESTVEVRHDELQVDEGVKYRVDHEPLTTLSLEAPKQILAADAKCEFLIDGQSLSIPPPASPANDDATVRLEVPLPAPRIGEFELQIRSRWPEGMVAAAGGPQRVVPLVMPARATLTGNTLTLTSEAGISAEVHDSAWSEVEPPREAPLGKNRPARQLTAVQGATEISLTIGREDRHGVGESIISRAWVQTWLTPGGRQDRAVYRLTSDDPVEITLPPGVTAGNVEMRLDGQTTTVAPATPEKFTIRVAPNGRPQHVLELRYQFDDRVPKLGTIEAELPSFNNVWVQRMYWQLVLPQDQHLVTSDSELTPEFAWEWSGLGWGRRAALNQTELEEWSGAEHDMPLPEKTNRYLFSVAGSPGKIMVRTAERGQIVLLASLAALIVGLLVIYVPAVRRPTTLLAAGVMLLALTAWNADLALLLAQASILGLALAVFAGYLERMVNRRRTGAVLTRGGSSSIIKRGSTHVSIRPLETVPSSSSTEFTDALDAPQNGPEVE